MTAAESPQATVRGPDLGAGLRLIPLGLLLSPLALALAFSGCVVSELPSTEETGRDEAPGVVGDEVKEMLRLSAESWNKGDLDGFLDDYWASDELTFSGGAGVTRGWEDVRLRYQQSYWSPGAERDSLRFEDLEVRALGEEHALALGRYVLFRPEVGDSITGTGFFSLVLRRIDDGWKIIHDHTSASSPAEGEDR